MAAGLGGVRVIFYFFVGFLAGILFILSRHVLLHPDGSSSSATATSAALTGRLGGFAAAVDGAASLPARRITLKLRKRVVEERPAAGGSPVEASSQDDPSSGTGSAAAVAVQRWPNADLGVCPETFIPPPDGVQAHRYRVLDPKEIDPAKYHCYQLELKHWELELYHQQPTIPFCSHDPKVDTVISSHLHDFGFWGSPIDYRIMMTGGPCTAERPYMLDIGANIGLFTVLASYQGCRVFAFEPLAENNHRLMQSVALNKLDSKVRVFKHAVGRRFDSVMLGFRASNPGSSAIGLSGMSVQETVEQITIDALLASPEVNHWAGEGLPPLSGRTLNFVKIDTEGWDVAVFAGALSTILAGRVPHLLIEFSPGDAKGTAGCDPPAFVNVLYDYGYVMYEHGRAFDRKTVLEWVIPQGLSGNGKRVWESWWLLGNAPTGQALKGPLAVPADEVSAEPGATVTIGKLIASGLLKDTPGQAGNPEAEEMAKARAKKA